MNSQTLIDTASALVADDTKADAKSIALELRKVGTNE